MHTGCLARRTATECEPNRVRTFAVAAAIFHPATKGVRQKESGKKVPKNVGEALDKESEKSDRTPCADLLLFAAP